MANLSIIDSISERNIRPEPIMIRKRGSQKNTAEPVFAAYKKKIEDPAYMDYAINKIALELTHFLSK
ncbi:MAG TPA: hypothetical protein PL048_21200 [Leptospiraceae bacterium]|nr:hypothetical protein [Leptospiraceae bacterium]HMY68842.1 hypothetical protein [Leptospiraceae bacterium]HMZ61303.1 hypothetical protein [Leptospiraceae bacterium]HNF16638.1 hypothetical protein [Leptospiraceae bacterium]HNF28013.1 hypothetical protein [Leptospiraceae bacterium]